eukprot:scaffold98810_cov69-Phaeocystis_antarctica.AAC.5
MRRARGPGARGRAGQAQRIPRRAGRGGGGPCVLPSRHSGRRDALSRSAGWLRRAGVRRAAGRQLRWR